MTRIIDLNCIVAQVHNCVKIVEELIAQGLIDLFFGLVPLCLQTKRIIEWSEMSTIHAK